MRRNGGLVSTSTAAATTTATPAQRRLACPDLWYGYDDDLCGCDVWNACCIIMDLHLFPRKEPVSNRSRQTRNSVVNFRVQCSRALVNSSADTVTKARDLSRRGGRVAEFPRKLSAILGRSYIPMSMRRCTSRSIRDGLESKVSSSARFSSTRFLPSFFGGYDQGHHKVELRQSINYLPMVYVCR